MSTEHESTPVRRGSYKDHAEEFPELYSADAALGLTYDALDAANERRLEKIARQFGASAASAERKRIASRQ